jgi:uncharacterized protein YecT (DUF1311 family)
MTRRNRTQDILDVKRRDAHWNWFGPYGLENLQRQWLKNRQSKACTPDFYVIRTVTLLGVFTRRNLADLIDHDRRFTDRAIELSRYVKIDFALIRDIQGRTITLGDILAHSVPVNSFGQIVEHFETILERPVRPLLETTVDRWETEVRKMPRAPIVDDYEALARCLTRLFEVRHILSHEAPREAVYDQSEIDEFLANAVRFVKAMHEILMFERFGLVPLTQTEKNIAAGEQLKRTEKEMSRLFSDIEERVKEFDARNPLRKDEQDYGGWHGSLTDAQAAWLSYRKAHCDFETYLNRGGTIRPLLWATEAIRLTQLRIADFESWLKRERQR